jgi:DNA-binding response OmpR family regulator
MSTETGHRVLLVDDDLDYLEQLRLQFEKIGYAVVTAADEQEARRKFEEGPPDLAVLDLMLGQADAGFALAHWIKSRRPDVPVIMVTGVTAETGLVFERSAAGPRSWIKADAVLAKPVRFEQILREMGKLGVGHE